MITLSDARRVIAAAEAKAHEIGQPMNIAVVRGVLELSTCLLWSGHGRAIRQAAQDRFLPALTRIYSSLGPRRPTIGMRTTLSGSHAL